MGMLLSSISEYEQLTSSTSLSDVIVGANETLAEVSYKKNTTSDFLTRKISFKKYTEEIYALIDSSFNNLKNYIDSKFTERKDALDDYEKVVEHDNDIALLTSKYVTLDTEQTINGAKKFTGNTTEFKLLTCTKLTTSGNIQATSLKCTNINVSDTLTTSTLNIQNNLTVDNSISCNKLYVSRSIEANAINATGNITTNSKILASTISVNNLTCDTQCDILGTGSISVTNITADNIETNMLTSINLSCTNDCKIYANKGTISVGTVVATNITCQVLSNYGGCNIYSLDGGQISVNNISVETLKSDIVDAALLKVTKTCVINCPCTIDGQSDNDSYISGIYLLTSNNIQCDLSFIATGNFLVETNIADEDNIIKINRLLTKSLEMDDLTTKNFTCTNSFYANSGIGVINIEQIKTQNLTATTNPALLTASAALWS